MLQKKEYQQQIPATPTTIKKPIVENQTSGKTKINATKEGVPATPTTIKKPIVENQTSGKTKINATKEGVTSKDTSNTYNNKETNCRKSNFW